MCVNTLLLLLSTVALQAPATWELKPPYQTKTPISYGISIKIPDEDVGVSATVELRISALSQTGMQGLLAWRQIVANDQPTEDWEAPIALTPRGALQSVESEFGPDARRMNIMFFPIYPEKPIAEDGSWSFDHKPEGAADTPAFTVRYTAKGKEKIEDVETLKVAVDLKEAGTDAMLITGFYWFDREGNVRKFELDIRNWPVPHIGQSVGAHVIGLMRK